MGPTGLNDRGGLDAVIATSQSAAVSAPTFTLRELERQIAADGKQAERDAGNPKALGLDIARLQGDRTNLLNALPLNLPSTVTASPRNTQNLQGSQIAPQQLAADIRQVAQANAPVQ